MASPLSTMKKLRPSTPSVAIVDSLVEAALDELEGEVLDGLVVEVGEERHSADEIG